MNNLGHLRHMPPESAGADTADGDLAYPEAISDRLLRETLGAKTPNLTNLVRLKRFSTQCGATALPTANRPVRHVARRVTEYEMTRSHAHRVVAAVADIRPFGDRPIKQLPSHAVSAEHHGSVARVTAHHVAVLRFRGSDALPFRGAKPRPAVVAHKNLFGPPVEESPSRNRHSFALARVETRGT